MRSPRRRSSPGDRAVSTVRRAVTHRGANARRMGQREVWCRSRPGRLESGAALSKSHEAMVSVRPAMRPRDRPAARGVGAEPLRQHARRRCAHRRRTPPISPGTAAAGVAAFRHRADHGRANPPRHCRVVGRRQRPVGRECRPLLDPPTPPSAAPGWQPPHERVAAPRSHAAARFGYTEPAGRHRAPRSAEPALDLQRGQLGRDRYAPTQSQIHRLLAYGVFFAVGSGNSTHAGVQVGADVDADCAVLRTAGRRCPDASVPDACLGWDDSAALLRQLAKAVRHLRTVAAWDELR